MPIYLYQCDSCGVRFERMQRMSEPPLEDCPECEGHVHRVIQPVGIIFKGSGFYVTDNRSKSSAAAPGSRKTEEKSSDEKPAAKTEAASSDSAKAGT